MAKKSYTDKNTFMAKVVMCIDGNGFQNSQSEYPTGEVALTIAIAPSEKDYETAAAAQDWIMKQNSDYSEYMYKLQTAILGEQMCTWDAKLVASGIHIYLKRMEEEREASKEYAPGYAGEIKQRLTLEVTIERMRYDEMGRFGDVTYLFMKDAEGHKVVWFASGNKEDVFEEGKTYSLKGTVKRTEEYRGVPTTYLTRCAIQQEATAGGV